MRKEKEGKEERKGKQRTKESRVPGKKGEIREQKERRGCRGNKKD